mgnify:CR=1 FL=1
MTCTICQSTKSTVAYYGQIRGGDIESILECSDCGVRYLKNMREYDYSDGYRDEVGADDISRHIYGMLGIASMSDMKGKTVLDVGCSDGDYMKIVSRHAKEVTGIEPNDRQREANPFTVYSSLSDALDIHSGKIDVVTMWHVIEHVQDPVEFLFEVSQLLTPNGKIYLSTPNLDDVLMKLLDGDFAKFFYRAWHTHYYHTDSLFNLAIHSGLNPLVIQNKHSFGIGNVLGWLKDKKPCGQGISVEPNQTEQIDHYFRSWIEHIGFGDTLYCCLQKEDLH